MTKKKHLILAIGEILFDIFPNYKRLGGAPFNFATHIQSFGFNTTFVSRIGKDENGRKILQILKNRGLDTSFIQIDETHETGNVQVMLDDDGVPEFEIIKDVAYDYLVFDEKIKTFLTNDIDLIYFGTLIQRTPQGFKTIQQILEQKPNTPSLYDVNLRQNCYNEKIIKNSLKYCDILKINDDEVDILQEMFAFRGLGVDFIQYLRTEFSIRWVSLTKGREGSILYTEWGEESIGLTQTSDVVDTVGAGDAYASILAIGYLLNWQPQAILEKATQFAGSICGIEGAIPENDNFYNDFKKWINGDQNE